MTKEDRFTPDFKEMIKIVMWNSMGFIFVEFIMIYVANQILGASGTQMGLLFSLITIGSLLSSFLVGYLTDRISKKYLIMVGSFGRGLSYLGFYFSIVANSLMGMYICSLLLGIGAGIFWIPLDTLISDKSSKYHRSSAFGLRRFAMGIGMMIGTVTGFVIFWFGLNFTPDNPYIIYGAFVIFAIANGYAGIQFSRKVDEEKRFEYKEIITNKQEQDELINDEQNLLRSQRTFIIGMILLFLTFFLSAMNAGFAKPFIQPYILENIENDPFLVALIYFAVSVIGTITASYIGKLGDKINLYITITIASIVGGFVTWLVIVIKDLWLFAILLVVDNTIALFSGFVLMSFLSRISQKHRGKMFGSLTTFEQLGFAIGPILGGLVWDSIGQTAPFMISIFVEWALIPLFLIGIWIVNPQVEEVV